jgi:hypothetical protein
VKGVPVVLCTHGVLGALDGSVRLVEAADGCPPPTLRIATEPPADVTVQAFQDAMPVVRPESIVTLVRVERRTDEGPKWAYQQPPATPKPQP